MDLASTSDVVLVDSNSNGNPSGLAPRVGSGVPDALAGTLGEFYLRTDTPGVASQNIYVCTVAGIAGAATWGALL